MKKTVLAVIPARGGSTRLARKNILKLAGKPLIQYSIDAAKYCPLVSHVCVSSEDPEILETAAQDGVIIIKRPAELATNTVSNEKVVEHAIRTFIQDHNMPDYIVLLQPTSPLRTADHLQGFLENYLASNMKSSMSICEVSHHPGKYLTIEQNAVVPYTSLEDVEKRSQDLEPVFRQNGAIYALKTTDFLSSLKFYQPPCLPYLMKQDDSIDVDTKLDFNLCEALLEKNYGS